MIKRSTIKHLSVIKSGSLDGFLFRSLLICRAILTNSPSSLSQRERAQCGTLRLFQTCYSIINRFWRFQLAGISHPFFSEDKSETLLKACERTHTLAPSHLTIAGSQVWFCRCARGYVRALGEEKSGRCGMMRSAGERKHRAGNMRVTCE